MGRKNNLNVPAERRYLSTIRDFIYEEALSSGASLAEIDSIIQAVDEASANIIIHGYKDGPGDIHIEVSTSLDQFSVILTDHAPTFDPTQAPQPDINLPLKERPIGGLGIHLIRHCVDEIMHSVPVGGGNQLVLVKKLLQARGNVVQIKPDLPILNTLAMGGTNPHGHTIRVNQRFIEQDGHPWFPIMGEFHFSRCRAAVWEKELRRMKAGGITVAATYIFWNHIEEIEGHFRWEQNNNLRHFIELCQKVGLYAFPRIGPWAHGECRNGGFPDWLLRKCGAQVRQDAYPYLDYVHRFYSEIFNQLTGFLWKDGGPVIGIQIENELVNNAKHISTLKKMAQEIGFDVPIYTMTGWGPAEIPSGEVIPVFGGYPDAFWERQVEHWALDSRKHYFFSPIRDDNTIGADLIQQPGIRDYSFLSDYPYSTCEIGGGMQVSYHRRPYITDDDIAALSLVKIGNGSNLQGYYMYHGGSNPIGELSTLQESQKTGYPNDLPVIDYDFQAPLGEYGQVRESYHALRMIHLFLNDFGHLLAACQPYFPSLQPSSLDDRDTLRWAVRSDGKQGFIFINNYQRETALAQHQNTQLRIDLPDHSLLIPEKPISIPENSYMIWPFHLDCSGVELIYATAQLLCKIQVDGIPHYIFSACPGVEPEFTFAAGCVEKIIGLPTENMLDDSPTLLINQLNPGKDCLFTLVTKSGDPISFLILPQELSRRLYKSSIWGRDFLIIANGSLWIEADKVKFQTSQAGPISIDFFPQPPLAVQPNQFGSTRIQDGVFTSIRLNVPERMTSFSVQLQKTAAPARLVPSGPSGVAQAPDDADFEKAQVFHISFPDDLMNDGKEMLLEVNYTGDAARATIDGQLVEDDFYSGRPWEIGLSRFADASLRHGLDLKILPLRKDAPIYLPETSWPDFRDQDEIVRLNSLSLRPLYEISLEPQ